MTIRGLRWQPWIVLGLVLLAVYWASTTSYPTGFADSDELLTASFVGGVAHPPGYGMLVWPTHYLMRVFAGVSPALVGNMLAGSLQAIAISVLAYGAFVWLRSITGKTNYLIPIVVMTGLGFSLLFWLYGTLFEVGPLANLLFSLWFLTTVKWWEKVQARIFHTPLWAGMWLLFGVGVGYYQPMILVIPGWFWLMGVGLVKRITPAGRRLITGGVGLALGILGVVIVALPLVWLRANEADFSWYVEPTLEGYVQHLFRQDYTVIKGEGTTSPYSLQPLMRKEALWGMGQYFARVFYHMGPALVGLALWGSIWSIKRRKVLILSTIAMWVGAGPLLATYLYVSPKKMQTNYFAGIAERQYFLGEMLIAILAVYGLYEIAHRLGGKKWLNFGIVGLLIGWPLLQHKEILLEKNVRQINALLAGKMIEEAQEGSLVLCGGDIDCFALYYQQLAETRNKRITILPQMMTYQWYFLDRHPEIYPFRERQTPDYLAQLIAWNTAVRPTYLTQGVSYHDYIGLEDGPFYLLPQTFLLKVETALPQKIQLSAPDTAYGFIKPNERDDKLTIGTREYWSIVRTYAGYLALRYGQPEVAKAQLEYALSLDGQNNQARVLLENGAVWQQKLEVADAGVDYFEEAEKSLIEGNETQAEVWLRKGFYADPRSDEVLDTLIEYYLESGNFTKVEGLENYRKTLEALK